MFKYLTNTFFRILFSLLIITIGLIELSNVSTYKNTIQNNLTHMQKSFNNPLFDIIKSNTHEFFYIYALLAVYSGFLSIFAASTSWFFYLCFLLLNVFFINNIVIGFTIRKLYYISSLAGLFGGILVY